MGLIPPWGQVNVEIRLELGDEGTSSSSFPTDDRVVVRSFRDGAHRAFSLRCSFPISSDTDMETEMPQRQDVSHVSRAIRQVRDQSLPARR